MVGVPSSRACEACRIQRKKCKGQQSPCARCQRLKIPCIGFGQLKYKFVDRKHHTALEANAPKNSREARMVLVLTNDRQQHDDCSLIYQSQPPSNSLSVLTSAFASSISTSIDIRYQLPWSFGGFLQDIPSRLGHNEALDAASDALTTAYARYCGEDSLAATKTFTKYVYAIESLSKCLRNPATAHAPETLAAIMLILIYQVLL